MNLLYVTFEYPPDTAFGGIGTYMFQITHAMAQKQKVYVIAATAKPDNYSEQNGNITVFRVSCSDRKKFPQSALLCYNANLHNKIKIDLIESPEYGADALLIKKQHPQIPIAVKFHTPSFLVKEINDRPKRTTLKYRLKKALHIKQYKKESDPEYAISCIADSLSTPSVSLGNTISEKWSFDRSAIQDIPNPFCPSPAFLQVPVHTKTKTVSFIGRLETRKGIIQLTAAIKTILLKRSDISFRFIGKPMKLANGKNALSFIQQQLNNSSCVSFINNVPPAEIPRLLAETDVCVFPSIWENFPNVCLEAMAAARGIVASNQGGMKDMLENVDGGILVDPDSPEAIADAIVRLIDNDELRWQMGERARLKIEKYYADKLIDEVTEYYTTLINS